MCGQCDSHFLSQMLLRREEEEKKREMKGLSHKYIQGVQCIANTYERLYLHLRCQTY